MSDLYDRVYQLLDRIDSLIERLRRNEQAYIVYLLNGRMLKRLEDQDDKWECEPKDE